MVEATADVAGLVDLYLKSCAARRLSPRTIRKYRDTLRRLPGPGIPTPEALELEMAKAHSAWSARTLWQTWRSFFRWAARRHGSPDPTADLAPPRLQQAARRIFTTQELRRIFDAAVSPRDKALVLLALDTGARLAEIASLRKADISNDRVRLNTNGQGDMPGCRHCSSERKKRAPFGKSGVRTIPITPALAELLRSIGGRHHVWLSEPEGKPARNRVLLSLARSDPLGEWLRARCAVGVGCVDASAGLYEDYREFLAERRAVALSQTAFGTLLTRYGFPVDKTTSGRRGIYTVIRIGLARRTQAEWTPPPSWARIAARWRHPEHEDPPGLMPTATVQELARLGYPRISERRVRDVLRRRPALKPAAPLTTEGVKQAFHRIMARAGIQGRQWGPHALRHSFATAYISDGGQLAFLQRILGHKDVKTTSIYLHFTIEDLKRDHTRHTPILRLTDVRGLLRPHDPRWNRSEWNGVKAFVMARDGRRCVDCGATEDLSLDHVLPRSLGGRNAPGNGEIRCVPCNRLKGARPAV